MIPVPSGVQVWLATGHTDMRKGFDGLALLVQETLKRNPHNGHLFVFRGRRGALIKVLWHDGQGVPDWVRNDLFLASTRGPTVRPQEIKTAHLHAQVLGGGACSPMEVDGRRRL